MQTSLFPHSSPYKRGAAAFVALATTFGALVSSGRPPLPAYAADGPMPQILEEYAALARHIRSIPASKLNKGQRQSFESKLDSSRKFYKKGDACKAIKHMDVFLKHAETFRKGNSMDAAEDLFNRGWMLKMNILMSLPEGERCGQDTMIGDPSIQIVQPDNQMFSFDVFFPSPMFTTAIGGGETWTRVHYPTLENMVGEVGQPAMPMWRGLVGIPHGSEVRIEMAAPVLGPSPHMNLVPFQPQAVDQNVPPAEHLRGQAFREERTNLQSKYCSPTGPLLHPPHRPVPGPADCPGGMRHRPVQSGERHAPDLQQYPCGGCL